MKAELKFMYDTEDYDAKREIELMQNAQKWKSVVWDLDQKLRERIKYEELTEEVDAALQGIRDFLWETLREENLDLND